MIGSHHGEQEGVALGGLDRLERPGLAIGGEGSVILLHHPLPLAGVSIGMEKGCQQSGSLADGCPGPHPRRQLPALAVDETVIFADALSPSLLKHLLQAEEGCSRTAVSPTACRRSALCTNSLQGHWRPGDEGERSRTASLVNG